MKKPSSDLVKIGQASKILKVSIDTLRRWEKAGKITAKRTDGGTRLYSLRSLNKIKPKSVEKYREVPISTEELLKIASNPKQDFSISTFPAIDDTGEVKLKKGNRFLIASAFVLISLLITTTLITAYFIRPEPPPNVRAIHESPLQSNKFSNVLAVTSTSPYLEINADTQISGSLFIKDFINGLKLEATPSAGTMEFASGGTTLTVTNNALLDQDVSTTSTPTFAGLNLTGTTLVGKDTIDTLTNKSMSGSSNTFTSIPNSALSNNKVTVTAGTNLSGGGDVNLGSAVTLALKDSPSITGTLTVGGASILSSTLAVTGATTLSSTLSVSGNVGLGTATPLAQFHNAGGTLFGTLVVTDLASGGNIGTAATTVDIYTSIALNQTTSGQTITLPDPTEDTAGRIVYLSNTGTASFTFLDSAVQANTTTAALWNGTAWTLAGGGGLAPGTINNSTLRWNSASTLWVENTGLLVDSSGNLTAGRGTFSGFVGIGSSLNVSGNVGIGGTATINSLLCLNGTCKSTLGNDNTASNGITLSALDFQLGGQLSRATGIDINSQNFGFLGGNVGIGTSTPDYNLSVIGTGNFTGNVGIGTSLNVTSAGIFGSLGTSSLSVSGASTLSTLITTGNVGVGASITGFGNLNGLNVSGYTTTQGLSATDINSSTLTTTGNIGVGSSLTVTSGVNFSSSLNVAGLTSLAGLNASGNVGIGGSASVTGLTYALGGLRVDGYSDLTGNVGVGGTAIFNSLAIFNGNIGGNLSLPSGSFLAGNGSAAAPAYSFTSDTDSGLWRKGTNLLALTTNGAGALQAGTTINGLSVNSTGNVGIGTTNPVYPLDVKGVGRFTSGTFSANVGDSGDLTVINTSQSSTAGLLNVTNTSSGDFVPSVKVSTTQTATGTLNASYGINNTWTSSAVVTGAGGQTAYGIYNTLAKIGEDTASGTYTTYGSYNTASNTGRTDTGTVKTYGGYFSATGDTAGVSTAIGLYATATGADNNYAAIFDAGNVGIGFTSPTSLFQVNSGSTAFTVSSTGNVGIGVSLNVSSAAILDSLSVTKSISSATLGVSGTSNLATVFTSGNVGIGATTSSNKLDVWGNARITGTLTVDGDFDLGGSSSGAQFLANDGSSSAPGYSFTNDTDSGLWRIGNNQIALTTSGGAMKGLAINSLGNVGIGSTNPSSPLDIKTRNTSGTLVNISYHSNATLDGALIGIKADLNDGYVTPTNQDVTGVRVVLPTTTNTNDVGTTVTLSGMSLGFGAGVGINQNGAGATVYNGASLTLPALTQTQGTLTANGVLVTTPSSITTAGTANGFNVSATGIGAGSLNGVNIGTITGGAGTETALNIGTGWDAALKVGNTTVINGTGVTQVAGGGTGIASYTLGDILYASDTGVLTNLGIGSSGQVLTTTAGVPVWANVNGSSCVNCLTNNPTSTQTLSPTGQTTTGLSVRQTSTADPNADIFNVTSSDGNTKYFYVDNAGNVSTGGVASQTLTLTPASNTTALTLVGTNVTTATLSYLNANNTQGTISNIAYGSNQTLTGALTGQAINFTNLGIGASNQSVTGTAITMPGVTNSNTEGTHTYTGLQVTSSSGLNQTGAGATISNGISLTIPALTQTAGTLTGNGLLINTPSSITTAGTANGLKIAATGVGAGTLYGVNIGEISPGAGTETALQFGLGWDSFIKGPNFIINSNGNLGIGTTDPSYQLQTTGNVGIGQSLSVSSAAILDSLSVTKSISGTTLGISGNSNLATVFTSGNVGIGATTSSNKLDVWGNARIAGTLTVDSTITPSGQFLGINGSKTAPSYSFASSGNLDNGIYLPSSNALSFATAGNDVLTLTAGGNVGIGTTNPFAKTHIQGVSPILRIGDTQNLGSGNGGTLGQLIFGAHEDTGPDTKIYAFDVAAYYPDLRFMTTGSDRMTIQAGGNVGIGTTNPLYKLELAGTGYISGFLGIGSSLSVSGNVGIGTSLNVTSSGIFGSLDTSTLSVSGNTTLSTLTTSGNTGIGGSASITGLTYAIGGLRVDGFSDLTGNVGIGGTSRFNSLVIASSHILPSADDTLDLGSDTYRFRDLYLGPASIHLGTSTSDEYTIAYDTTDNSLGFNINGSGISEIVFNSSGNVGIGFTSPDRSLQVGSDIDITSSLASLLGANGTQFSITGNSGTGLTDKLALGIDTTNHYGVIQAGTAASAYSLALNPAGGNIGIGTTDPVQLFQINNNTSSFVVTSAGNVGIGITNPGASLEMRNHAGYELKFAGLSSTANIWNSVSGGAFYISQNNGPLYLGGTSNATHLTVASSGNVGINDATPSYTLEVAGTLNVTGAVSCGSGCAAGPWTRSGTFTNLANVGDYVGIGTTSPTALLDVSNLSSGGSSLFSVDPSIIVASVPTNFTAPGDVSMAYDLNFNNPTASYIKSSSPLTIQAGETFASSDLTLETFNFGNLVLKPNTGNLWADGTNVGIGTTNPGALLDVNGILKVSAYNFAIGVISGQNRIQTEATGPTIRFLNTANGYANLGMGSLSIGANYAATAAPTSGMIVEGNVGIGTTGPTSALVVKGSYPEIQIDVASASGDSGFYINKAGTMQWQAFNCGSCGGGYADALFIENNGGVGVYLADGGTGWSAYSDRRLKENIEPLDNVLEKINSLSAFTYNLKNSNLREIGFMAQDIKPLFPQLVSTNDDGYMGMIYDRLGVIAIQGIKEQQSQLSAINLQLSDLNISEDGTLNVPAIKTGSIVLDPSIGNLSGKIASIEDRIMNYESRIKEIQDKLDTLGNVGVGTESASVIPNASEESSTSSAEIATGSSTLRNDDVALELTDPAVLLATSSAALNYALDARSLTLSDATISGQLTAYDLDIQNGLKSLGQTTLGNTLIAGDLTVDGTMSITGNSINAVGAIHESPLQGILYLQNSTLAQRLDILNGLFIFDSNGTLAVNGTVLAEQFAVKSGTSAGTGTIPAGQIDLIIENSYADENSVILITPHTPLTQTIAVADRVKGGFLVKLALPESVNITFDYLIVGVKP